ncbi:MAG: thiamine phosphate synthase [Nitrospirae bacterium]|nr:thiamine phosphate synthase [Nitrospirota bacterium]
MATLPPLYLITDRRQVPGGDLLGALDAALAAGVRLVQLREKDLDARALHDLARRVKVLADRHGAGLLVNGRADIALDLGIGVHLPGATPPVAAVRALLGPRALIGVSTHRLDEVRRAADGGASFVTFGPVFDTPSKRALGAPVGTALLARAVAAAGPVPVFALGGVRRARLAELRGTGCHGVALISEVLAAPDPGPVAADLLAALSTGF